MAFSLLYVGLCRILGLIASFRRTESDRDIEIMVLRHQVRILERQLHARVRYRPVDRAILAAFSRLLPGGGPSWSLPTHCCGGTEKRPSTNGGDGASNEALADRG